MRWRRPRAPKNSLRNGKPVALLGAGSVARLDAAVEWQWQT